jgi:formaldehyde-activating enzyme involved in methanogenesis
MPKRCQHEGCKTRPHYNYEGQTKALYCATHKLPDMVDILHKRCKHEGCKTRPYYNYEGQTKALYCATHKLPDMVDIKNKRCKHEGCNKQPHYNYEGQTKALYCATHKLPDMVDIKNKRCKHEGCNTGPSCNYEGQSKALYCAAHKLPDMVDIKHKRCQHEGCNKHPAYNYEGQTKALYCATHKLPDMVDIINKRCLSQWCTTRVSNKLYEGYCMYCFMHLFPDKPLSRNYKTKEQAVVQFVKEQFPDIEIITDKRIQDGCSRRRPDIFIDLGYQIIIVEVDENQHIDYDCSCENKRIMELSQDVGHRPIIFIRFNPDDYSKDGKNITSCWGNNKQGVCCIKKNKQKEWDNRLKVLQENITYWLQPNNQTNRYIQVVQLYYDE